MISKQSGSEQAFLTLQVDFHTAQDGGSGYFLLRRTLTFFSQFVASVAGTTESSLSSARSPLHPKPTWQLQVSLGPLLLWHTADSLCAHLAHTQTFPGGGHATTLGERQGRVKALLLSVRSMGTTEIQAGMQLPSPALVHPSKIAQWFGHDKGIERCRPV